MNVVALSRFERLALVLAALALLAVRLPFLPTTLEDIDSVNFDLGVHDFDPLTHQPHPPGYTVYIAVAKLVHPVFSSHAQALAFVSAVFGAATIVPLVVLMRLLVGVTAGWLASLFVVLTPVVWFNSVRPMSDTMGLFAVLSALALLVLALERRGEDEAAANRLWNIGTVVAAVSLGIRIQTVMLVGPLLAYGWWRQKSVRRTTVLFFGLGLAAWLIPLIALSGGPGPLWRVFVKLVNDAAPVEPLLNKATWHVAAWAVHDSFFAPWGPLWFSVPVVACAAIGTAILAWRDRRRLWLLLLLFLPYATYHFLLQWTDTIRYALPIVPAMAALAAVPFTRQPRWRPAIAGAAAIGYGAAAISVTAPALQAYATTPSPPAQAIERLDQLAGAAPDDWVISGHFMFFRNLPWLSSRLRVIRPVERTEWRRLCDYWKGGGRQPVLFLRERGRTSLMLIDQEAQQTLGNWQWPRSVDRLVKGARPTYIDLVRIDPPRWFAESGFLITYEAGPVPVVEREPHRLYVRTEKVGRTLIVSGTVPQPLKTAVTARAGETELGTWTVDGPFSLRMDLEPSAVENEYLPITFDASAPLRLLDVWLERSSASTVRPGEGFYLPERDEDMKLFRWMGPDASSLVLIPEGASAVRLRLRGLLPAEYFRLPVRITFAVDGDTIATRDVSEAEFELEQEIPANGSRERGVQILTSQHFVPDDTERNGDRRRLAARVYELAIVSVIRPEGTTSSPAGTQTAPPTP